MVKNIESFKTFRTDNVIIMITIQLIYKKQNVKTKCKNKYQNKTHA